MSVTCGCSTGADPMTLWSAVKVRGRDKNPQKRTGNFVSVSSPRQDLMHPGLSVSRRGPVFGSGYFLQDWTVNHQNKP